MLTRLRHPAHTRWETVALAQALLDAGWIEEHAWQGRAGE